MTSKMTMLALLCGGLLVGSNALDWYEEEQEQNGEGGKAFRGASLQKR